MSVGVKFQDVAGYEIANYIRTGLNNTYVHISKVCKFQGYHKFSMF